MAVAVPVHARDGQVVAAVGIDGPRVRLDPERLAAIARTLPPYAARISERLGGSLASPASTSTREERR
jgi:DNA-binding IclR family transcriptional regulator